MQREIRMKAVQSTEAGLTPAQQLLSDLWDEHVGDEFAAKDTTATLDTMVPDAYVNHIPVLTGGVGRDQLEEFYSTSLRGRNSSTSPLMPRTCSGCTSRYGSLTESKHIHCYLHPSLTPTHATLFHTFYLAASPIMKNPARF